MRALRWKRMQEVWTEWMRQYSLAFRSAGAVRTIASPHATTTAAGSASCQKRPLTTRPPPRPNTRPTASRGLRPSLESNSARPATDHREQPLQPRSMAPDPAIPACLALAHAFHPPRASEVVVVVVATQPGVWRSVGAVRCETARREGASPTTPCRPWTRPRPGGSYILSSSNGLDWAGSTTPVERVVASVVWTTPPTPPTNPTPSRSPVACRLHSRRR